MELTLNRLFDQVMGYIMQQGATPTGPGITVYYDAEFSEQNMNVGACMPFEGSLNDGEQVKVVKLPRC